MSGSPGEVDARILRLSGPVVFFPVRHHSPACARLVSALAERLRPKAILIEGPSDFNPGIGKLHRGHELPIAIYSYVRLGGKLRHGAFYPFCVYSPEWQALEAARRLAAPARFIDLPYRDRALRSSAAHLYADTQERRGSYFESLAAAMGLEGFDNLWDTLFEIDAALGVEAYFERAHRLMFYARSTGVRLATWSDQRREAFMAERIAAAQAEFGAPLLVVTGGFHSYALFARLHGVVFEEALPEPPTGADAAASRRSRSTESPSRRIPTSVSTRSPAMTPACRTRASTTVCGTTARRRGPIPIAPCWLRRPPGFAPSSSR